MRSVTKATGDLIDGREHDGVAEELKSAIRTWKRFAKLEELREEFELLEERAGEVWGSLDDGWDEEGEEEGKEDESDKAE